MGLLASFTGRLSKLKKSGDFDEIIPELEAALFACEAAGGELKDALETAPFESTEKLEEIQSRVIANEIEQRSIRAAIKGAQRRRTEAANAENQAKVEQRMREAKKAQSALLAHYISLHEHLTAATSLLQQIKVGEDGLQSANAFAAQNGREDLQLRSPWWLLNNLLIGHEGHVHEHPSTSNLPGYFPRPHPDGPALARMNELKL